MATNPSVTYHKIRDHARPLVAACIPICQPDADLWLDRLLTNLSQVPLIVCWFADNIQVATTLDKLKAFPQTYGVAEHYGLEPFDETFRNHPYRLAVESGARWMLRMDCDEELVNQDWPMVEYYMAQPAASWKFKWYNVWQETLPQPMIRLDPPFRPQDNYRVVLHPLVGYKWEWKKPIVASAYCDRPIDEKQTDCRILHRGFSTPALRQFHKERWDRLYAIGGRPNPYGMWNAATIEGMAWLYPWKPWLNHDEWCREADACIERSPRRDQFKPPWER